MGPGGCVDLRIGRPAVEHSDLFWTESLRIAPILIRHVPIEIPCIMKNSNHVDDVPIPAAVDEEVPGFPDSA